MAPIKEGQGSGLKCKTNHDLLAVMHRAPALLVFWIRRTVPEPEEWYEAQRAAQGETPRIRDLFGGQARKVTLYWWLALPRLFEGVRPVHQVPAATVSNVVAYDGRWFSLQ
jgi:hypothetical protein